MKLTGKQWNLINEVSLKIHMTDDLTEMRQHFMSLASALVEFDAASFYIQTDEGPYGEPLGVNLTQKDLCDYVEKFADIDPFIPLMDLFMDTKEVIKTSDYAVMNEIESTEYYRLVWKPKKIRYALFMPLSINRSWLGSINFFRYIDKEDFSEEDMEILTILKQHMQARLWREKCMNDKLKAMESDSGEEHGVSIKELVRQHSLTERECDVIKLWMKGFKDDEICDRLFISKNTLKKHISNIFHKLEINSRVELLRLIDKQ